MTRSVVVPLQDAADALASLPIARALAKVGGAMLHLVHVSEPALAVADAIRTLQLRPEDVEGAIIDTRSGEAAPAAVELAERHDASALVVRMGRMAEEVLRLAMLPVVLVRPGRPSGPWQPRRMLLPLDGTPASALAIDAAAALAIELESTLFLLHVAGPRVGPAGEPGTITAPIYTDQPQHEWKAWSREFVEREACRCAELCRCDVRLHFATGVPAEEIARAATREQIDLIVLAWHGRLDAGRAGTLRGVIRDAPCPVMVLRI